MPDPFRDLPGLESAGAWQGNNEFLATPSPYCIGLLDVMADRGTECFEDAVSDQVPISIVILFEKVDVQHDQAKGRAACNCLSCLLR